MICTWTDPILPLVKKSQARVKLEHCQTTKRPFWSISFLAPCLTKNKSTNQIWTQLSTIFMEKLLYTYFWKRMPAVFMLDVPSRRITLKSMWLVELAEGMNFALSPSQRAKCINGTCPLQPVGSYHPNNCYLSELYSKHWKIGERNCVIVKERNKMPHKKGPLELTENKEKENWNWSQSHCTGTKQNDVLTYSFASNEGLLFSNSRRTRLMSSLWHYKRWHCMQQCSEVEWICFSWME